MDDYLLGLVLAYVVFFSGLLWLFLFMIAVFLRRYDMITVLFCLILWPIWKLGKSKDGFFDYWDERLDGDIADIFKKKEATSPILDAYGISETDANSIGGMMSDSLRPVLRATAICDLLGGMLNMQKTIGATAIQAIENGVQFSFEGCEFANKVQITETKPAVYELEFWHFSPYTHATTYVMRFRDVKDVVGKFIEFTKLQLTKSEKPANLPPPPSATFKPKEKTKTTLF